MRQILSFLLIILLLSIIAILAYTLINIQPSKVLDSPVEFYIKKGDSSFSVAERLYIDGIIRSKLLYISLVKVLKLENRLQSGWVEIRPEHNLFAIIYNIYTGNFINVTFTIPEGTTFKGVLNILKDKNIVSEKEIDELLSDSNYLIDIGLADFNSPEGFLFPDTYKFKKGVELKNILSAMVRLFYKKLEKIYPTYELLSKKELYEKVIMASIIEKEVKLKDEAKIVAGIFYNRIKKGMRLQSCATVQYILEKPQEHLLESDLLIVHPYNTYLNKGLPPGPICNPGLNALEAAFYPDKNSYLFFVVKDPEKGSHHFSETYEEHLYAQKKYKQIKGFY